MSWVKPLLQTQRRLGDQFGRLVSWANIIIILALFYEVCMRYLFDAPTNWAHETSTMVFGGYCLASGVYTQIKDGHVRIDIIHQLFGIRGQAILNSISSIFVMAGFTILLVISFNFAMDSFWISEVSSKSSWRPLLYPIKAVIPLTVLLLMINQAIYFIRDLCVAFGMLELAGDVIND